MAEIWPHLWATYYGGAGSGMITFGGTFSALLSWQYFAMMRS